METNIIMIGSKIPQLRQMRGGCLKYQNGILTLFAAFAPQDLRHKPKWDEYAKGEIQLGLFTYEDVMMLAVKIGPLPWVAVPYTPHWDDPDDFPPYQSLNDGETLPMNIVLVRSEDGQVMGMRLFGPSTAFSREMLCRSRELRSEPYSGERVYSLVRHINSQYTPYKLYCEKAQVKYVLPANRG